MPLNITGVEPTLKAMRKFDKDLTKQMNIEIKAAMITIRDKARGDVPQGFPTYLSGWEKRGKGAHDECKPKIHGVNTNMFN